MYCTQPVEHTLPLIMIIYLAGRGLKKKVMADADGCILLNVQM